MKLKKFALKGLIFLFVGVALCMFFARTIQTITTAKIERVQSTTGRLEDKVELSASVHFPETTEYTVEEAQKLPFTVDKVYVKEGHYVEKGEILFTSKIPNYDESLKKLQDDYKAKAEELISLDIANRKLSKQSKQNELYDAMLDAQDNMSLVMYDARVLALENGITLSGDVAQWEKQLSILTEVDAAVTQGVKKSVAAKKLFDDARTAFFNTYEDKKIRLSSDTFKYINDRNTLIESMDELNEEMATLALHRQTLSAVTAPQAGYIVAMKVASGDAYDGTKAAYVMSKEGVEPVLRASLSSDSRTFAEGTKVEVPLNEYSTEKTTVLEVITEVDNSKYLHIQMPASVQSSGSSAIRQLIRNGSINVTITYRAQKSTTLLPASCVRSDGENQYYVYLLQNNYGNVLTGSSMYVQKTTVTVIDKTDKQYSIQEDLSWQQVADREDRTIQDKQTVMEYID